MGGIDIKKVILGEYLLSEPRPPAMSKLVKYEDGESKIIELRGQQVILDSDVAVF